jgi:pimeloyl-ACP methyl ester carboxylesterase
MATGAATLDGAGRAVRRESAGAGGQEEAQMPEIKLSQGTIHYREEGSGPPVLLVHGLLVNGTIWSRVVPALAAHARCIVPDLPLGSHPQPMDPEADLSPSGLAALLAELISQLELRDVTLVGNDTGGALCQLVAASRPEIVNRLVLTNCDAFESFPPRAFKPLVTGLGRIPGAVAALAASAKLGPVRRGAMAAASLTTKPIPDSLIRAWVEPLGDPGVRRDLVKVLRGIDPSYTLRAAEQLRTYDRPVLLAWGARDKFFPLDYAERLRAVFPQGRLEKIENARTFVPLDAPDRLAELVGGFVGAPGAAQV